MLMPFRTTAMRSESFEAFSRAAVDECWERVLAQGVETESGPKEFPHYAPGYYAAFFYDPDSIKLEVVHEPTRAATTAG
jgi:catechol 2,3-dioxygenase-like lactoylglutathione lyase family enzyme